MSIKIMFNISIKVKMFLFVLSTFIFLQESLNAREIGKFKDWASYAEGEGKNLACMA